MDIEIKNKAMMPSGAVIKFPIEADTRGFFSLFIESIRAMDYAVVNNCQSKIEWTGNCYYSNPEMFGGNNNAWEYYFKNNDTASGPEILNSNHVSVTSKKIWSVAHFKWLHRRVISKLVFQSEVKIRLDLIVSKIQSENVLGVHVRRTDHAQEVEMVKLNEIIETLKVKFTKGKFTKIFISTDDDMTLQKMVAALGMENCLYNDVYRSDNGKAIHKSKVDENGYLLGCEALSDVIALSACKKVVLCNSNFSYAVMLFNPNMNFKVLRKERSFLRWLIFKTWLVHFIFFISHIKYVIETIFLNKVSAKK